MFNRMTGVFNKVRSTLGKSNFMSGIGAVGSMSAAAGRAGYKSMRAGGFKGAGMKMYGAGVDSLLKSSKATSILQSKSGRAGIYTGAAIGGSALGGAIVGAADFANPWGLGWGD